MDELLKPVKTVRHVRENISKFETLSFNENDNQSKSDKSSPRRLSDSVEGSKSALTYFKDLQDVSNLSGEDSTRDSLRSITDGTQGASPTESSFDFNNDSITSPEQALDILKTQYDGQAVEAVVKYLGEGIKGKHSFNIQVPSAVAGQIVKLIVIDLLPDWWPILTAKNASESDNATKKALLLCCNSPIGLGALLAQAREVISAPNIRTPGFSGHFVIKDIVSFLTEMAHERTFLHDILTQIRGSGGQIFQQQAAWNEIVSLLAGSKLLNVFQEAALITELKDFVEPWLHDTRAYVRWLGTNIVNTATNITGPNEQPWIMLATFLKRAMSLGHTEILVSEIYTKLLWKQKALWTPLRLLSSRLSQLDQAAFLQAMLSHLEKTFLKNNALVGNDAVAPNGSKEAVGGVACIVARFIEGNKSLEDRLIEWLTKTSGPYATKTLETRRALILVLAQKEDKLRMVLERAMKDFADKLHIKHDSVLQQQALAQVILLTAGCLARMKSKSILDLSKSSSYLHAVSNRLASSLPPARFLGMVIGMAISQLTDEPGNRMKFDVDEMKGKEAQWWFSLVNIEDSMGSIDSLKKLSPELQESDTVLVLRKKKASRPVVKPESKTQAEHSKIISIEEIDDSDSADDLVPHQKPDSDPEDSDEDPTLINRSKPNAPIYIHDLIKSLNVNDKPDIVELALKTAPSLIRRKATFGTELAEKIDSLASALINLSEGMSEPELAELRLQSLIACLVAQPTRMGPWLAAMYFEGDFSISQRASLLTAIGLASRELAGHKSDDDKLSTGLASITSSHDQTLPPSQTLPAHLLPIYTTPIATLTNTHQKAILEPLALAALDSTATTTNGPRPLKTRTISTRPAVQAATQARAKARSTRIPKDLHRLLAESIYLPLCCRMSILLSGGRAAAGTNVRNTTVFDPTLVRLFLQTLTLILTTLGPYAVQLPTVARETILLLNALQRVSKLALDAAVLPALLTLFLALLDVCIEAGGSVEERLVTEDGEGVLGLLGWINALDETGADHIPEVGGRGEMGMQGGLPWTVVAAGVQVRWEEVRRRFEGRVLGVRAGMVGFDGF